MELHNNPDSDFDKLLKSRRSIRSFQDREVSEIDIVKLVEAARWAPSNNNRQAWQFLFVQDQKLKQSMSDALKDRFKECKDLPKTLNTGLFEAYAKNFTVFEFAPVVMVSLYSKPASVTTRLLQCFDADDNASGEVFSVAMAVSNILLKAHELGLGSCVLSGPLLAESRLREILNIAGKYHMGPLVALGWPDEQPEAPRRKQAGLIHKIL